VGGAGRSAVGIEDRQRLPGIVGKELLAGAVLLAHRTLDLPGILSIELAELRIAVAGVCSVGFDVLFPQQLQGDAFAPEFAMNQPAVRLGAQALRRRRFGEQSDLNLGFVEVSDQRPRQPFALGTTDDLGYRAQAHAQGRNNLAVAQSAVEIEPK
jgi:hypothetical protein